ncbi:DUF5991 domain-containing protein [Sphingomonas crusticola]|uniref:DUF5991 domain-containing protein n=1 Tax=Sphingomonas crusticola TaxID=1697973 RepID=UPI0013C2D5CC|nr:DUF5991 domain-containing protein [Sphingomonas crusticola]
MTRSTIRFAVLGMAAFAVASATAAPAGWNGTYLYEQSLGPNLTREVVPFVNHRLVLDQRGCRLTVRGYQTDEQIICDAVRRGAGLEIRFRSYADGSTANKYGVKIYRPGQPLFALTKETGGLTTTWQSYTHKPERAKQGVFFRKS